MIRKILSILLSVIALNGTAGVWLPDTLIGDGYYDMTVDQPADYSGKVVSTIVRKSSSCGGDRGILYIHGFNDYFFQKEMGDEFVDSCYNFYAVDLRKYGRSILPGQKRFQVRNLNEYFPDIDSALAVMKRVGIDDVVLIGHSTGGLIASLYMAENPDTIVKALILNSPFLDWNLSKFNEKIGVPVVSFLGRIFPNIKISQGGGTAYSESLLAGEHGEWHYNTGLKLRKSPDVDAGWINAINSAQHKLRSMKYPIKVPVLLMHSDKSVNTKDWDETHNRADGVLDVNDIVRYGVKLGHNVTPISITGGLHDLVLSSPKVRKEVYHDIFKWLINLNKICKRGAVDLSLPLEENK
ncbi:MAG: alpha/beta hydrolase [Muribaculaceae bacterium]|nr:alpha/beta hydrolase [Muribaculaceae bacterium]